MKKETGLKILRRVVFAVIIAIAFFLQYTASSALKGTFTFPTGILIPITVCIAMAEKEYASLVWGLIIGIAVDFASSSVTDGIFTLYFAVFACAAGLLAHYLFRNSALTAILFTFIASAIFCVILIIPNLGINIEVLVRQLTRNYLPSVFLSTALTPIIYSIITALSKKTYAKIS